LSSFRCLNQNYTVLGFSDFKKCTQICYKAGIQVRTVILLNTRWQW